MYKHQQEVFNMEHWLVWIILGGGFLVFLIIQALSGEKKPFRKAFLTMCSGLIALAVVNITGAYTGVTLPVSILTLCGSAVGGIPGVTLLLVMNMIL